MPIRKRTTSGGRGVKNGSNMPGRWYSMVRAAGGMRTGTCRMRGKSCGGIEEIKPERLQQLTVLCTSTVHICHRYNGRKIPRPVLRICFLSRPISLTSCPHRSEKLEHCMYSIIRATVKNQQKGVPAHILLLPVVYRIQNDHCHEQESGISAPDQEDSVSLHRSFTGMPNLTLDRAQPSSPPGRVDNLMRPQIQLLRRFNYLPCE